MVIFKLFLPLQCFRLGNVKQNILEQFTRNIIIYYSGTVKTKLVLLT